MLARDIDHIEHMNKKTDECDTCVSKDVTNLNKNAMNDDKDVCKDSLVM